MCFDEPIYLDRESFEELMEDTDQNRICWLYHDILSDPQIAWMFDRCAGEGEPIRDGWTTMAWVAAGRRENSFYLLFKWYDDFYSPPVRSDLYYVERNRLLKENVRVRFVNLDFQKKLNRAGRAWCRSFLGRVSDNASWFFGDSTYDDSPMAQVLQVLDKHPGRELDALDRWMDPQSDGEKALQCTTMAAYFQSIRAMSEIIYSIVTAREDRAAAKDLVDILYRITDVINVGRLTELSGVFQRLAGDFCGPPVRAPFLSRNVGRVLREMTEQEEISWLKLGGRDGRRLLRELYCRRDPNRSWDVFVPWQGEAFFTVFRRRPARHLPRGVYLLARFRDQTGQTITDLFWLENLMSGTAYQCEGDFFDDLLDLVRARPRREVVLPGRLRWEEDLVGGYVSLLKQAFDRYNRSSMWDMEL